MKENWNKNSKKDGPAQGIVMKENHGTAESMSAVSRQELAIRNRIATIFLTIPDEKMYNEVLKIILEILESEFGVFGYLDEDGALVVPTMTRHIWEKCKVAEKKIVFPRETWGESSWARSIREKKIICSNEPSTRTPEGHVPIERHLSQPIVLKNEVVGILQVANKKSDYDDRDLYLLNIIADTIAPILKARLQRDIEERERKKAEEKLKETIAELTESNRELEQFAYVASHDLQEPLRMVASYVQLLERRYKGRLDADADDFIAYAVDGANRMQLLINDLLAYSRVGRLGKEFELCDCALIIEQAVKNLEVAVEESCADIICEPVPKVKGDPVQFTQLFQNLIGNAIKFRSERPLEVLINSECGNGEVIFSVKDNGIGMSPDYFDRIFKIFQRLHGRGEYPGTGIGLAISKKIVERHSGRIWVESEPGRGSVFFFTIPERRQE